MKLAELTLRMVRVPLIRPYVLSYRTFTEFEPVIVEVRDADGRIGWGEGHISPGSSSETREGGWAFCREHAAEIIGKDTTQAKAVIAANLDASKVAATALLTAIEMLEDHPLLRLDREVRLPLLTPFNSSAPNEIAEEPSAVARRCASMPIAPTAKPRPAALPKPSTPPGSNCSNSLARPKIGTRMPGSPASRPFQSCWMSRSARSTTCGEPAASKMLASASSS